VYRDNKTWLAGRVWSVATVVIFDSGEFISFFLIVEVVIFDSVNLLNLSGEDLWSSGIHIKKTRRIFILVDTNHHTGVTLVQL
jgi:hypothetical protein